MLSFAISKNIFIEYTKITFYVDAIIKVDTEG